MTARIRAMYCILLHRNSLPIPVSLWEITARQKFVRLQKNRDFSMPISTIVRTSALFQMEIICHLLKKQLVKKSEPGDFVNQEGEVVGRHKGYYGYTIGQRKGLGISAPKPYYVTEIRPEENKVIVGSNEDLFKTDLIANDFNWIENLAEDEVVKARIRYHQTEKEATARKNSDGTVDIHFLEPQRAITKGQAVVLYRDNHVVGGGTIIK